METTRLSSKGQVIIPYAIRLAHQWTSGIEFVVTDTKEGILLTPLKHCKTASVKEVLGCVGYKGSKKSLRNMREGIAKGAKERK